MKEKSFLAKWRTPKGTWNTREFLYYEEAVTFCRLHSRTEPLVKKIRLTVVTTEKEFIDFEGGEMCSNKKT